MITAIFDLDGTIADTIEEVLQGKKQNHFHDKIEKNRKKVKKSIYNQKEICYNKNRVTEVARPNTYQQSPFTKLNFPF